MFAIDRVAPLVRLEAFVKELSHPALIAALALTLGFAVACEKATGVPSDESASTDDSQKVFESEGQSAGISPSHALVAGVSRLPEGTPITIRLQSAISSNGSKADDSFEGRLDDPIVIEGHTQVPRGAPVTGRVLAAKASGGLHNPGYLRIALIGIQVDGQPVAIETSSLFVKGDSHERRNLALAVRAGGGTGAPHAAGRKEVSFGVESRLTFRLAQAVDLH